MCVYLWALAGRVQVRRHPSERPLQHAPKDKMTHGRSSMQHATCGMQRDTRATPPVSAMCGNNSIQQYVTHKPYCNM
jgi:hypothetical protein